MQLSCVATVGRSSMALWFVENRLHEADEEGVQELALRSGLARCCPFYHVTEVGSQSGLGVSRTFRNSSVPFEQKIVSLPYKASHP